MSVAVVDEITSTVLVSLHQDTKRVVWWHIQCVLDPEMATFVLIPLHCKHHSIQLSLLTQYIAYVKNVCMVIKNHANIMWIYGTYTKIPTHMHMLAEIDAHVVLKIYASLHKP